MHKTEKVLENVVIDNDNDDVNIHEDLLELSLGLALGEVVHVIVLGRHSHQPLWLHVCARPEQEQALREKFLEMRSPDVVFGCEDKLIVENPLWFVIQTCAGVKLNNLKKKTQHS